MISVLPIKEKLEKYCAENGIGFSENVFGVRAEEGENELGFALFTITGQCLTIHKLFPTDDLSLADGILRSALFFGVNRGVLTAKYSDTAPGEIFSKLNFIADINAKTLKLDKLFDTCGCQTDK